MLCWYGVIWHTLLIIMQNVCSYSMIWHTLVTMAQNIMFLWYDMAYHVKYNAKLVFLWYDMTSTRLCKLLFTIFTAAAVLLVYGMLYITTLHNSTVSAV